MSSPYYRAGQPVQRQAATGQAAPTEDAAKKRRRTTTIVIVVIVAIVLLILIGIAIWWFFFRSRTTTPTTTKKTVGEACTSNTECNTDLCSDFGTSKKCTLKPQATCTAATCPPTCEQAGCPPGYLCYGGKCLGTKDATCSTEQDCHAPFTCSGGTCKQETCIVNSDCDPGEVCRGSRCVLELGTPCNNTNQCNSDLTTPIVSVCTSTGGSGTKRCKGLAGTLGCETAQPAETCTSGLCVTAGPNTVCECVAPSDCPFGDPCVGGICI